ncbi:MAG: cytochrome c, partial [Candidatus Obscuribacterales bacterium]|nr:cytochrome c [Candidatus Obscuribacterales bacterium]
AEYMRELLRKPYVIYDYMYSNGVRKEDLPRLSKNGFVESSVWAKASIACAKNEREKGALIFRYQCMSCHTESGYRGIKKLIAERDQDAVVGFLKMMKETERDKNPYLGIMPPLVCNDEEIQALSKYLASIGGKNNDKIGLRSSRLKLSMKPDEAQ